MAINFPSNPAFNDTVTDGTRTWRWNGRYWESSTSVAGYTGSQGDLGYTGSAGQDGVIGQDGYTGSAGQDGVIGQDGYTGSQGDIGYTGSQGDTGFVGSRGDTGFVGSQGDIGYTGSQGDAGFVGSQGDTGFVGSQGEIGYTGSQGDIGFAGSQGDTGFVGSQGDTGFVGSQGDLGYTGSEGVGFAGSRGDVGYTGSQGDLGYTGSVGFTGSIGGFEAVQDISVITQGSYTLQITDAGKLLRIDTSGGTAITIPNDSQVNFAIGQRIDVQQADVGTVVFDYSSPVDVLSTGYIGLANQNSVGSLIKIAANTWTWIGPTGYTGSRGDTGYTGSQGDIGYTGSQGELGDWSSVQDITNITATSYTLTLPDAGNLLRFNNSTGVAVSLTEANSDTFSIGQRIEISQAGTGTVVFDYPVEITVISSGYIGLANQDSVGSLIKVAAKSWLWVGPTGYTGSRGDQGYTGSQGDLGYTGSQGDTGDWSSAQQLDNITTATYTISSSDAGKILQFDTTTGTLVSLTESNSDAFSVGQRIEFTQVDTGGVVFDYPGNINVYSTGYIGLANQNSIGSFVKIAAKSWLWVGPTGYTGSQGIQGDLGYTGSQGDLGYTGSQGAGFTGSQGDVGFAGSQGDIGYTGSQGDVGFTGSQGDIGYTGSQGDVGFAGSQGDIGYTGSQGDIGYTGSQGDVGFTGSQGDTGFVGSQGDVGFVGSQGDIGYTGSQGDIGYTGSQGDIGYTGSQGDVGFTGSKGDIGYTGSEGYTGSQGIPGEAAAIGYTGSQGDIGYTGSAGIDGIIGVDGFTGSIGYTGSQGYSGSKGDAGAYNVGNTQPSSPGVGDRWYDTDSGIEYTFIDDGNDTYWVELTKNFSFPVLEGNVAFGTSANDIAIFNSRISSDLIPSANISFDLGSPDYRWRDIYLSGDTIDLGGATIKSHPESGAVSIVPPITAEVPNPQAIVITHAGEIKVANTVAGELMAGEMADTGNLTAISGGGGASVEVSTTAPESPVEGDMWLDSTTGELSIYVSNNWLVVGGGIGTPSVTVSSTTPISPQVGDLWLDTSTGDFSIYVDTGWIEIGGGGGGGASIEATDTAPASPGEGDLWLDTNTGVVSVYYGGGWISVSGGDVDFTNINSNIVATGTIKASTPFFMNPNTITSNITIPANTNAMSAGPIEIANGVVVTISDGAEWSIV